VRLSAWRPTRADLVPLLLIVLLPTLLALPQLTPWVKASPMYYVGGLTESFERGPLRGVPYIDPNNGFQTQALGYRAAADWTQGKVPWWNPYTGVGLPLAAEYQGSAFFPLTPLLLLPRGTVLLQWALQVLAGLGAYALLRQLGLARLAATAGGLLYAVNGTLAWFAHGPASAVPFLPWMLLGVELARCGGWRVFALAMAVSLLAGFPETAYINGLLALSWAILRGFQAEPAERLAFARRLVIGGTVGIAIAAPQVVSFFLYLPEADVAAHAGDFADAALLTPSIITTLLAPYAFGSIFAHNEIWLAGHWGGAGGYVSIALVAAAIYGFWVRRDALALLLAAWIVTTIGKTFGFEPFTWLWNLVPGVTAAAFARYAHPTWELAFVILAARGIDSLRRREHPPEWKWRATAAATGVAFALAFAYGASFWRDIVPYVSVRNAALGSTLWAFATAFACLALLRRASWGRSVAPLCALLVLDAALLCAIPILSNPRGGQINMRAINFLQAGLGFQRFATLGPIAPNYGARFGIASINHNYLPVAKRWIEYVKTHLDTQSDVVVFDGLRDDGAEMRRNLPHYEEVGVKYVVARKGHEPFAGIAGPLKVYRDNVLDVFELPGAKPYFEVIEGSCTLVARERTALIANCETPAKLLRRELFFPGWTASVNGNNAAIAEHGELFQAIELPAGTSEVTYDYAPPYIGWAWLAAWAAALALIFSPGLRASLRRRLSRRSRATGEYSRSPSPAPRA
jgi:hypothetical protein